MEKDLVAGASDQGQSLSYTAEPADPYQHLIDTPPSLNQTVNVTNLDSSFIDENEHDIPYSKLPRGYGEGELRLGTYLILSEDVYSLGFVSLLRNEIVDVALLKEEASRPKTSWAPRTPRLPGTFDKFDKIDDEFTTKQVRDDYVYDDQIYEDE